MWRKVVADQSPSIRITVSTLAIVDHFLYYSRYLFSSLPLSFFFPAYIICRCRDIVIAHFSSPLLDSRAVYFICCYFSHSPPFYFSTLFLPRLPFSFDGLYYFYSFFLSFFIFSFVYFLFSFEMEVANRFRMFVSLSLSLSFSLPFSSIPLS